VRGDETPRGRDVGAQPLEHGEHVVVGQHRLGDGQRQLASLAVQTLDLGGGLGGAAHGTYVV